jgi:hypothetical protein
MCCNCRSCCCCASGRNCGPGLIGCRSRSGCCARSADCCSLAMLSTLLINAVQEQEGVLREKERTDFRIAKERGRRGAKP